MTIEELLAERDVWGARFDDADRRFRAAADAGDVVGMNRWLLVQSDCLENVRHYSRLIAEQVEAGSYGSRKNTPDVSGHAG